MSVSDSSKNLSRDELKKLSQKLDQQLKDLQNDKRDSYPQSATTRLVTQFLLYFVGLSAGLIAPFIILIRASIYFYASYQFSGWLALLVGMLATIFVLLGYIMYFGFRYNRWRINKFVQGAVAVLVAAYTCYGLLYYSGMNMKTDEVRNYYRSLHPIMRVALSTITLADNEIVVTDIQRISSDYAQMGLPENKQSLHYVQPDGYVHAVDLRTKHRAEWKNWLMHSGFNMIGLQTIRHNGTADHLHVYLPLND